MDTTRVNFIIGIGLAVCFSGYVFVKLQNNHISKQEITAQEETYALSPMEEWEIIRKQRADNLTAARENGISHQETILQKCDCTNLSAPVKTVQETAEQALAQWQFLECQKACQDTKSTKDE